MFLNVLFLASLVSAAISNGLGLLHGDNIPVNYHMAQFAPRMLFTDGCQPLTAYNIYGAEDWTWQKSEADLQNLCHVTDKTQMYGRFKLVKTDFGAQSVIVYAWLEMLNTPDAGLRGFHWQYMVVWLNVDKLGKIAEKPLAIWTPVGGISYDFHTDDGGHHPWLQQSRPDAHTPAGIHVAGKAVGAKGVILPIVDVDVLKEGVWNPAAQHAVETVPIHMPANPLGNDRIFEIIKTAQRGFPIGYPKF